MADEQDLFNQLISGNNNYLVPRAAIGGFKYNQQPGDSTGKVLGIAAGQSLLTGILDGLARKKALEENNKLTSVLGSLANDPLNTPNPGFAPDRFGQMQLLFQKANIERDQALAQKVQEAKIAGNQQLVNEVTKDIPAVRRAVLEQYGLASSPSAVPTGSGAGQEDFNQALKGGAKPAIDLAPKAVTQEADRMPSLEEYLAAGGTAANYQNERSYNLDLRKTKISQEENLRKEFSKLPQVAEFLYTDQGLRAIKEAVKDNRAMSDVELTRRAIQAIEPGLAVRTDDQTAIANSQSIPNMLKGKLASALNGETALSETDRSALVAIAERAHTQKLADYTDIYNNYSKIVEGNNFTMQNVIPYKAPDQYAFKVNTKPPPLTDKAGAKETAPASDIISQIKQKIQSGETSMIEVATGLRAKGYSNGQILEMLK